MPDSSKLLRAYAVVGPDELKRKETLERIKAYLDSSMADFNLDVRDGSKEENAQGVLSSLAALPFGDSLRIVIVEQADKLIKDVSEAIVTYLDNPNPSSVLLLVAESLRSTTKLYKAVSKQGKQAIISCEAPVKDKLTALIVKLAKAQGFTMGAPAAQELAHRAGGQTQLLAAHIETLAHVCAGQSEISLQAVKDNIAQTQEIPSWEFLDAVSQRNARKALEIFVLLPKPSYVYLQMILYERVREILITKALCERGDYGAIKPTLIELSGGRLNSGNLQDWKIKHYREWARRFTIAELTSALRALADFERDAKGSGDERAALIRCVDAICGSYRQ